MGYNKIKLGGGQICDYLYIQSGEVDKSKFNVVNSEPLQWQSSTIMLSTFNDGKLTAGNSSLLGNIVGYELRRRKGSNAYSEYVTTIKETDNNTSKLVLDYAATNNSDYTYYLYPSVQNEDNNIEMLPMITESVITKWNYWSLLVVDETEVENVYYIDKIFKFGLNLDVGEMSNNAVISVNQNFTPYPTIQYGASNYWSGSLSSLAGIVTCTENKYIQPINAINELKALTSDGKRKFLKDTDGNLFEVKIVSPISISTNSTSIQNVKTVKISWAEVADTLGVSIVNNPDKSLDEWILTETGEVVPYKEYVWDDNATWDDNYIWTESDKNK